MHLKWKVFSWEVSQSSAGLNEGIWTLLFNLYNALLIDSYLTELMKILYGMQMQFFNLIYSIYTIFKVRSFFFDITEMEGEVSNCLFITKPTCLIVIEVLSHFSHGNYFSVLPLPWFFLQWIPETSRKEVPSGVCKVFLFK